MYVGAAFVGNAVTVTRTAPRSTAPKRMSGSQWNVRPVPVGTMRKTSPTVSVVLGSGSFTQSPCASASVFVQTANDTTASATDRS